MLEWSDGRGELAAVARMLVDVEVLESAIDVVDFVEKPWKWEPEREAWVGAGRPGREDPGWDLFAARLERRS